MDRGWSMKLSWTIIFFVFALALIGVARADNEQIQQLCVNAATCLLAIRSGSSPNRKSGLQMHRAFVAFDDLRGSAVSDIRRTNAQKPEWKLCGDM
jgi:hypothetical protein